MNKMEREIEVPDSVRIILSLGEKFIIPYKRISMGEIVTMIRGMDRTWENERMEDRMRVFNEWK